MPGSQAFVAHQRQTWNVLAAHANAARHRVGVDGTELRAARGAVGSEEAAASAAARLRDRVPTCEARAAASCAADTARVW